MTKRCETEEVSLQGVTSSTSVDFGEEINQCLNGA